MKICAAAIPSTSQADLWGFTFDVVLEASIRTFLGDTLSDWSKLPSGVATNSGMDVIGYWKAFSE